MTNELLSPKWQTHFAAFEHLIVGFSGGLDSTVLLDVLASYPELHSKIIACHVNHGISPYAEQWQLHCQQRCRQLGVDFITETVDFVRDANIEEAARNARYAVFAQHIKANSCLILGHHLDDQAETLLLQLFRGAGVDGLAAMADSSAFSLGHIARPLLTQTRQHLEHYAIARQLSWIEDESNQDRHYARNYLRHEIIPLIQKKWPAVVANVANTALHCQAAQTNLRALAAYDCPQLNSASNALPLPDLMNLSQPRLMNVLRVWLQQNKIKLPATKTLKRVISELIMAAEDATPVVAWGAVRLHRYQHELVVLCDTPPLPLSSCLWLDFPKRIQWHHLCLVAEPSVTAGVYIPQHARIEIRARQGGETLRLHGQTKSLKKLLQQWKVAPWIRAALPLIYINEVLAAIPGYAVSDLFSTACANSVRWQLSLMSE